MAASPDSQATQWRIVWLVFVAGVLAAAQIGKLPPTLTLVRAELDAGLVLGGWIASTISVVGFATGLVAGAIADRIGIGRVIAFGLLSLAVGSIAGALATSAELMLAARAIEGLGFTATTVTGTAIIARATSTLDRRRVLGFWSIYMPAGFAGMLLLSAGAVDALGWRGLWVLNAGLCLVWAAVLWRTLSRWSPGRASFSSARSILSDMGHVVTRAGGLLVAGAYALYAAQHIALMSWLPTYVGEAYHVGALTTAAVPALVLAFNAGGNFLAARALGLGWPIWLLLSIGAGGMVLTEAGIYLNGAAGHPLLHLAFAVGFGVAGGLVPASSLASAPVYAPTLAQVGAMSGLMVMATNAGQLFGPPALAAARIDAGGWIGALWLMLCMSAAGLVLALLSRASERRVVRTG
ncbi:MAG: MFS transporter [Alphaproteobacteria bacterium]